MGKVAIYPGSFDPVTYGHLDVMQRAARIFDKVIVAVADNASKTYLFSHRERLAMVREASKGLKGIKVVSFNGLVTEFAKKNRTNVLIRGLRMISDFEYEFQMALTNRKLDGDIETLFMMPNEDYSYLSSKLIKEISSLGARVSCFVPGDVEKELRRKLKKQ